MFRRWIYHDQFIAPSRGLFGRHRLRHNDTQGRTGWNDLSHLGSRSSLEGHETPGAFVLTPHTAPSYSDRRICLLGLRLADQLPARLREGSLWLALPDGKRARFPLI